MLELSQLRCFVTVAEELNFRRAAARLNMTQPPLSRHIQLLEHSLGASLFERTTRRVALTATGRRFLTEAQTLLRLAESAELSVKRVFRGEVGTIRLGFTAGSSYAFLPRLVSLTSAQMPDVDLMLREMPTAEQMEALRVGHLDAALVRLPIERRGVELVRIARDKMVLAIPDRHALTASQADCVLHELGREPFIMYSPEGGRYFHDLVSSMFREAEIAPEYVQLVTQIHTALALVSAGLGVALVPEAARSLLVQGVVLRELRPPPRAWAELHLAWPRDLDNPAFRSFCDTIVPKLMTSQDGGG